jgi:hypothetical protein
MFMYYIKYQHVYIIRAGVGLLDFVCVKDKPQVEINGVLVGPAWSTDNFDLAKTEADSLSARNKDFVFRVVDDNDNIKWVSPHNTPEKFPITYFGTSPPVQPLDPP